MILDKDLEFSQAQVLGSGAATVSANVIDMGAARDLGVGETMEILVTLTAGLAGAGTVVVTVEQDDNAAFTSPTVAQTIGTFGAAALAGSKLSAKIQPEGIVERYVRLKYTSGVLTAGAVSSYILHGVDHTKHYADAITITG